MKPSIRILAAGAVIEAALAALWVYLLAQIGTHTVATARPPAEAVATIGSVMGTAMGVLCGLLGVIFLVLRGRGR